jgi:tetratricopeptide (TPR) repeat protein
MQPDWQTLREIWSQYLQLGNQEDLDAILSYASEETQHETEQPTGIPPAYIWYWQSTLYADVGRADDALRCLRHAHAIDSRQYFIRHALAISLKAAGQLTEAEPHYRWCLARRPEDKNLNLAVSEISKERLAQRQTSPGERPGSLQSAISVDPSASSTAPQPQALPPSP